MRTFHTTSTDISVRYVRLLIHSPGKKKIEVKIENRNWNINLLLIKIKDIVFLNFFEITFYQKNK